MLASETGIQNGDTLEVLYRQAPMLLTTGSLDGTVRIWNTETGGCINEFPGHDACAVAMVGQNIVMSSAYEKPAKVYDPEKGAMVDSFGARGNNVTSLKMSQDGGTVLVASKDCEVVLRNTRERGWQVIQTYQKGRGFDFGFFMTRADMSSDGTLVAATAPGNTVNIWEAATAKLQCSFQVCSATGIAFSPDSKILAVAQRDGRTVLFCTKQGKQLRVHEGHAGQVFGLAWSPNNRLLATAGQDGRIRIWSAKGGEQPLLVLSENEQGRGAEDVVFSSDSRFMATASGDAAARLFCTDSWMMAEEAGSAEAAAEAGIKLQKAPQKVFKGHASGVCLCSLSGAAAGDWTALGSS